MSDTRLDVLAIGNAIVDVIAEVSDDFLNQERLTKGSMRLIDTDEAERLYGKMSAPLQVSGGSAGNTAAGVAALGGRAGFLVGTARGKSLEQSLQLGAIAAAEVIQHYGARPEADLRALAGSLLD